MMMKNATMVIHLFVLYMYLKLASWSQHRSTYIYIVCSDGIVAESIMSGTGRGEAAAIGSGNDHDHRPPSRRFMAQALVASFAALSCCMAPGSADGGLEHGSLPFPNERESGGTVSRFLLKPTRQDDHEDAAAVAKTAFEVAESEGDGRTFFVPPRRHHCAWWWWKKAVVDLPTMRNKMAEGGQRSSQSVGS